MVSANEITIPLDSEEVAQLNRVSAVVSRAYTQCWNNLAALFSPGNTPDMGRSKALLATLKIDVDALSRIKDEVADAPRFTERHIGTILALQETFLDEITRLSGEVTQHCGEMVKGMSESGARHIEAIRHDSLSTLAAAGIQMSILFRMLEPKLAACDRINTGPPPERRTR